MLEQQHNNWAYPPTTSLSPPPLNLRQPPRTTTDQDDHWKHFDNSVNAVSFGFVATAILISMFLIMAIFERFLRPAATSSPSTHRRPDLESQIGFHGKLGHPSPKMSVYSKGVSVLMPGENIPTFMAHLAPVPCPPERTPCPPHQHNLSTSNSPTFR